VATQKAITIWACDLQTWLKWKQLGEIQAPNTSWKIDKMNSCGPKRKPDCVKKSVVKSVNLFFWETMLTN